MNFFIGITTILSILFILSVLGGMHYFLSNKVKVAFIRKVGKGLEIVFYIFVFFIEITIVYLALEKLEEWAIFCFNYLIN